MPDRSQLIDEALGLGDAPRRTATPPVNRRSLIDQALSGTEAAGPGAIVLPGVRGQPKREIVVPGGSQAPSRGFLERTVLDPAQRVAEALDWSVFGPDRALAQKIWGFTPEEMGQDVLERIQPYVGETGAALGATGMHLARELATPLNLLFAGLPAGMGAIRRLLPRAPVSGLPSEMAPAAPKLLQGPPGELRYVEEPPEIQELQTPGYPVTTKRGMTKFEEMPGPPTKRTELREIELEGMPEITYEPRPMEPSETLIEDALAAKDQLARQETPKRLFVEGQGMGGTPERVIGIPSGYPDWYRQLTTGAEGVSPISRKTIDAVLDDIIRGRPSHPSRRRARAIVTEAIQGARQAGPRVGEWLEDVVQVERREPTKFTGLEPVEVEEPSTLLVPYAETGTEWTRGTLRKEIPRGHYEWVANGSGPRPSGPSLSRMPREVIDAAPTPQEKAGRFKRWFGGHYDWWRRTRGQELPIVREVPGSPVITGFEGSKVMVEEELHGLLKQDWMKGLARYTPEQWKSYERQAFEVWNLNGRGATGYQLAMQSLPAEFREMLQWRATQLRAEQELRAANGLSALREIEYPYFPRVTRSEWSQQAPDFAARFDRHPDLEPELSEQAQKAARGAGPGALQRGSAGPTMKVQTGIGQFGKRRRYETMLAGEMEGMRYVDPMRAFLYREIESAQMRETIKLIQRLKQDGILFDTREAALLKSPTRETYPVKLGEGRFLWARTLEEGKFLQDNWKQAPLGPIATGAHYANVFVRNPSLVNPFPHLLKNMLFKYGLAGGSFRTVSKDFFEYLHAQGRIDPAMLAEFRASMPFSESGNTVYDLINQARPPESMVERVGNVVNMANRWSAKKIFSEYDPALRWALWKQYRETGLPAQDAANHVWLDLVRYGARSEWIDWLKSIPSNFFVPWRVGTIRTLQKAWESAPVRTAAYIGLVDTLREIDYRRNGRWTHLPIDYLERPIAELIRDPKNVWKTGVLTLTLGPGGEYSARTLETLLKDAREGPEWKDLERTFWGLAQIYDIYPKFKQYKETGDLRHLADIAGLLLIGRHEAKFRPPGRLLEHVPEAALPKSGQVLSDEQLYEARTKRRELRERRRQLLQEHRP